jgi:hypothetical protein
MGNYIGNGKNAFCGGRPKQPPAKMTYVLAGDLSNRMAFVLADCFSNRQL